MRAWLWAVVLVVVGCGGSPKAEGGAAAPTGETPENAAASPAAKPAKGPPPTTRSTIQCYAATGNAKLSDAANNDALSIAEKLVPCRPGGGGQLTFDVKPDGSVGTPDIADHSGSEPACLAKAGAGLKSQSLAKTRVSCIF